MSKTENDKTIDAYNQDGAVDLYVANNQNGNVSIDVKELIDKSLIGLPKNAKILEIGSGPGYEADYIESRGYRVERTDAAKGFVDYQVKQGHNARLLNAITDPIPKDYDYILANAVLLHFSHDDARKVMSKVFDALSPGGKFVLSVKEGDGEKYESKKIKQPRYFTFWQFPDVEKALRNTGFQELMIHKVVSSPDSNFSTWLNIIAHK